MQIPAGIKDAFASFEGSLNEILNATGCREGWLQGELFRYYRRVDPAFSVNTFALGNGKKADLHGTLPEEWVAELKIYGQAGYFHKNIYGYSDISEFLPSSPEQRVDVTQQHLDAVHPKEGSLLKDCLRLRGIKSVQHKFMVLVIHKYDPPDDFGLAISAIRLSQAEVTFDYSDFLLRIWRIDS